MDNLRVSTISSNKHSSSTLGVAACSLAKFLESISTSVPVAPSRRVLHCHLLNSSWKCW